jgi:hypothetical protein
VLEQIFHISVTTQKSLEKIPYGISVPTQETCYSSIESRKNTIWNICDNTEVWKKSHLEYLRQHMKPAIARWYFFHTLLKATYYAAVTGFMCCHRYSRYLFQHRKPVTAA